MKRVIAKVDMFSKDPIVLERGRVFNNLCLLLMLLRVFDEVQLKCSEGSVSTKTWRVDWAYINRVRSIEVVQT